MIYIYLLRQAVSWSTYKYRRTRKLIQVDASLQNQNLRTDLRWAAKRNQSRLASSRKSQEVVNITRIQLTYQLVSTCLRIWARPKSTQVNASQTQVGGQTNCTFRRLASPFGQRLTLETWFAFIHSIYIIWGAAHDRRGSAGPPIRLVMTIYDYVCHEIYGLIKQVCNLGIFLWEYFSQNRSALTLANQQQQQQQQQENPH